MAQNPPFKLELRLHNGQCTPSRSRLQSKPQLWQGPSLLFMSLSTKKSTIMCVLTIFAMISQKEPQITCKDDERYRVDVPVREHKTIGAGGLPPMKKSPDIGHKSTSLLCGEACWVGGLLYGQLLAGFAFSDTGCLLPDSLLGIPAVTMRVSLMIYRSQSGIHPSYSVTTSALVLYSLTRISS